jgi:hypothetical protein
MKDNDMDELLAIKTVLSELKSDRPEIVKVILSELKLSLTSEKIPIHRSLNELFLCVNKSQSIDIENFNKIRKKLTDQIDSFIDAKIR